MMGACAFDPDYPLSKTNNAVLMFADSPVYEPSECIRCGKCVTVCQHNALKLDVTLKGKRRRGTRQEDADA